MICQNVKLDYKQRVAFWGGGGILKWEAGLD